MDNVVGLENDPNYIPKLIASMGKQEFEAKVQGDWTRFQGMAFMEWEERQHVVKDFPIPLDWKVIR